jgi:hypothetical protein
VGSATSRSHCVVREYQGLSNLILLFCQDALGAWPRAGGLDIVLRSEPILRVSWLTRLRAHCPPDTDMGSSVTIWRADDM